MKIISYMDFLFEGRRADAIQSLITKYNGNKEQALQDITHVEQQMMQMFNNQGLVNKYIYSVMNFIESSDNTGHSHENSIRNVLNDMKRLIDWEPRMKQHGKQLHIDQLDKMSWFQFNAYLNDFYDAQPHDKWKSKYKKEINIKKTETKYEIVHIPTWDTAKRYMGDKLTWCVTQSETAFLNYTSKGEQFVFAFNPNYDELEEYYDDQEFYNAAGTSSDEFAVSALAIRIHPDGKITVTCRYNHDEDCNDDVYGDETVDVLKELSIYDALLDIIEKLKEKRRQDMIKVSKILQHEITEETITTLSNMDIFLSADQMNMFINCTVDDSIIRSLFLAKCDKNSVMEFIFSNRLSHRACQLTSDIEIGWPTFIEKYKNEMIETWTVNEITRLHEHEHALYSFFRYISVYNEKMKHLIRMLYNNNIYFILPNYLYTCAEYRDVNAIFDNLDMLEHYENIGSEHNIPKLSDLLCADKTLYIKLLNHDNIEFNMYYTLKTLNLIVPINGQQRGKGIGVDKYFDTFMITVINKFIEAYDVKANDYDNKYTQYLNKVLKTIKSGKIIDEFDSYIFMC